MPCPVSVTVMLASSSTATLNVMRPPGLATGGIAQQVREHLLEARRIGLHDDRLFGERHDELVLTLGEERPR